VTDVNLIRLKRTDPKGYNDLWRHLKECHPERARALLNPIHKEVLEMFDGMMSLELEECCMRVVTREEVAQPTQQKILSAKEMGRQLASHFRPMSNSSKT